MMQVGKDEHNDGYRVERSIDGETEYWWPHPDHRGPACLSNDRTVTAFIANDGKLDWKPSGDEPNCTLEWPPCWDGIERMFAVPMEGFTEGLCSVKYRAGYWNAATKRTNNLNSLVSSHSSQPASQMAS